MNRKRMAVHAPAGERATLEGGTASPAPVRSTAQPRTRRRKATAVKLTHVSLTNWRNFGHIEFDLDSRLFVVGPNSSGKTNLLGALRFLGDIARRGLRAANEDWGGPKHCFRTGSSEAGFSITASSDEHTVEYALSLRTGRLPSDLHTHDGATDGVVEFPAERIAVVNQEHLRIDQRTIPIDSTHVTSPTSIPVLLGKDYSLLDPGITASTGNVQSVFEQVRQCVSGVRYIHPNPKKMKERLEGRFEPDDHGTGFFQLAGRFPATALDAVVARIRPIMAATVPEVPNLSYQRVAGEEVVFYSDDPQSASSCSTHDQFSEGTLRLLGILFDLATLPRSTTLVLLEEPETFLQPSVVRSQPAVLAEVAYKKQIQMVKTTHSPELLSDETIGADQVLLLRTTDKGTTGELLSESEDPRIRAAVEAQFPPSEVVELTARHEIPSNAVM